MAFYKLLARYLTALGIIIAIAVVLHLVAQPSGLHITEAELSVESTVGYQAPPATLVYRAMPEDWSQVALPNAAIPRLALSQHDSAAAPDTQLTWYRVVLPQAVSPADKGYLYIPRWKSDGTIAVYVNGALQYQSHANLQWNGSNRPLRIAFDVTEGAAPINAIVIRLQHLRGIGGALSSLWVGNFDEVGPAYMVRNLFQAELSYLTSAAFLASGVFSLLVWFRRRQERLYLLFFLMSAATFIRGLHNHLGLEQLPLSDAWFGWLTVNSTMWMVALSHLFLITVLHLRASWITTIVGGATLVLGLVTLPLFEGALDPTLTAPFAYAAAFVVCNLVGISAIRAAWRRQSMEGLVLAVWVLLTAYLGINDLMLQNNLISIEGYFILPFVQIALVFAFFHTVLAHYLKAVDEVERSNIVLAERLEAREAELVASHERVREIEQRELLHHERQRLTEDMHDGLGSSLLGALRMVERGRLDEAELTQILQGCIDDLKLTIDSMEPVETDLLLLLGTLRFRLQPRLESTGIKLHWDVHDVPPLVWLDQRHALHILRVLQEAFTNIIKHADATEATVSTSVAGGDIVIGVSDNGKGFDPAAPRSGRGLANQARRASAIKARLTVESGPEGTRLTLLLPIEQRAEGMAAVG
ncbi:ATP-binding protein [Devosia sp.]|uniref:sensor histidine kinase n=1 Tax=Devosia sp. TaxID=1871048 RepID=UPI003F723C2F